MNRSTITITLLLVSLSVASLPVRLVPVDATALPGRALAGLRTYGRTANFLLLEDSPRAQATLARHGILAGAVEPGTAGPLYVVVLRAGSPSPALNGVPILFRDGDEVLVQLDERTASRVAQTGAELVRLSDRPYQVRLASDPGFPMPAFTDTFVQRLVNKVSPDSIHARLERLQAVRTRYTLAESCRSAEQYVFDYFTSLGLDSVEFDTYLAGADTARNVVGTIVGRTHPEKVIIACGHMDSESEDHFNFAPGMEDNGSGTCMGIEAARVLAHERLDQTVKFIAFTGEEQGLWGSDHYAREMRSRNVDIIAAINYDMNAWPGGDWGTALVAVAPALQLARFVGRMAELYTTLAHRITSRSFPSDSRSFDNVGYPAMSAYEYGSQGYIWYHTTGDTLGNLSMPLAAEVAKMTVASLATLARAPLAPQGLAQRDAGNGTSLLATWQPNTEPDLAGYKLLWSKVPYYYSDSAILGRVTSYLIPGLETDSMYHVTVTALDSSGFESGSAPEDSAVPRLVPQPPAGTKILPFSYGNAVHWQPNCELDLAGYNIYRSIGRSGNYVRLNAALLSDTSYRDSTLMPDTMYYYVVTAIDSGGGESDSSAALRGKPITLDHGILLVDETRNGNGSPGSPNDAQQDAFYHILLAGYQYCDWDADTDSIPLAGDVGPYSTVVWHADDYSEQMVYPSLPGLANYLAHRGRLWLVGWKPIRGLMNAIGSYPYTFAPGQFPADFLHLSRAEQAAATDFTGATGTAGYPGVDVDSAKLYASMHGRLPYVDIPLSSGTEPVLTYNSFSGDTFQGKPVGVRWLTEPGKVVFFGFPFYFMKDSEARPLAHKVLDDLGEPYGIVEHSSRLTANSLQLTIRPNPLRSGFAVLHWNPRLLGSSNPAVIRVYDASGCLVLNASFVISNSSFSVDLRSMSAGVYMVRLSALGSTVTQKLVIQR